MTVESPGRAPADTAANGWGRLSAGRIPSLDGLRAASITMVIGFHWLNAIVRRRTGADYAGPWNAVFNGELGVSIFFVISGFLITHLLLREQDKSGTISLPAFYARRSFRIWPAYYMYLAAVAVLDKTHVISFAPRNWVAAATFTFNYAPHVGNWWVGHTWSLSVEEQFYLLWPCAVMLLSRRSTARLAMGLLVAVPLVRLAELTCLPAGHPLVVGLSRMTHTRLDTLMFGCCVAVLYDRAGFRRLINGCDRWGVTLVAALFLPASGFVYRWCPEPWVSSFEYTVQGACITLVLLWAVRHADRPVGRVLNWGPIVHVGQISFSLYLWQQLFFVSLNLTVTGRFPLNLLLSLALAELSHFAIEQPFLAMRGRVMDRRRPNLTDREQPPLTATLPAATVYH